MKIILYTAKKEINDFLSNIDLREDGKWYYSEEVMEVPEEKNVNDFARVIHKSKEKFETNGYWIPAIKVGNNLHCHPSVRILTNRKTGLSTICV